MSVTQSIVTDGESIQFQSILFEDWSVSTSSTEDTSNFFMFNEGAPLNVDPYYFSVARYELYILADKSEGSSYSGAATWSESPRSGASAEVFHNLWRYNSASDGTYNIIYVNKCTACSYGVDNQYTNGAGTYSNQEDMKDEDIIVLHYIRGTASVTQASFTYDLQYSEYS